MAHEPERWDNPRGTIANLWEGDDLAYATSGMRLAALVVRSLGWSLARIRRSTILDFGCGTGRVARPLAFFFGRVIGYDPSAACLEAARRETARVTLPPAAGGSVRHPMVENVEWTASLDGFRAAPADAACVCHVLVHLDEAERAAAVEQVRSSVLEGGPILVLDSAGTRRFVGTARGKEVARAG